MSHILKLTQIGNSLGIILPKNAISDMGLYKGDEIILTRAPGGFRISAYDYRFAQTVKNALNITSNRRNALRELARVEKND